jgi:hypothetical protein
MTRGETRDQSELPIACTLDGLEAGERLTRWSALSERTGPVLRREVDRLVVAYPARQSVSAELEALAAAERRCCAFLRWEVVHEDDHVLLHIIGSGDGLDAIAAIVAAGEERAMTTSGQTAPFRTKLQSRRIEARGLSRGGKRSSAAHDVSHLSPS